MTRRLASLAAWWHQLGGALTGDAPHRFAAEYPGGCWCDKPEEHEIHGGTR